MIAVRGSDLFNEHRIARLTRLCARLAGPDHADDLAQETLVEALRHANRLHDPSGADAWLAAIARNVALRWRRAAARQERVRRAVASEPNHSEGGKPELDLEQAELADVLQRALSALPDRTRDAVVRSVVMGSSHADIARRHDASPASVAMRISRGKTLLRRSLSVSAADRLAEFGLADAADRVSWRPTQLWCPVCGAARLDIQWLSSPAVIRLRTRHPEVHRPFRVPGGQGAFVALAAVVFVFIAIGSWVAVFPGTLEKPGSRQAGIR